MTSAAVAIYNADHTILGTTTIRHAVGMLVRQVAEPYEWDEDRFFGPYRWLRAVILKASKYVYPKWLDRPAPFSGAGLRARDHGLCAYCGQRGDEVEHILPKSRGGPLSWDNCVLACRPCNSRKENRTPDEAGMVLRVRPWTPSVRQLDHWVMEGRLHRRRR